MWVDIGYLATRPVYSENPGRRQPAEIECYDNGRGIRPVRGGRGRFDEKAACKATQARSCYVDDGCLAEDGGAAQGGPRALSGRDLGSYSAPWALKGLSASGLRMPSLGMVAIVSSGYSSD